jgi:uncharacterized protein
VALVIDTGPILADLDASDPHHEACTRLIHSTRERRVIPAPVLPEVDHLARTHIGPEVFLAFLRDVRRGSYDIEELVASDYDRVGELLETYRDLGFVDAAVLAIVERLAEPKLMTLDRRHFATMRPHHRSALELLPEI